MWDLGLILSAAAGAIRREAARFDQEQAPLGVDALDELEVHPLLREGLAGAGYGVLPEQRYPAGAGKPKRSEGDRCDIVLTEQPGQHLIDPLSSGTLFGDRGVEPEEIFWLEVKVVGQFVLFDGAARADPGYSSGLLQALSSDIRKLSRDERTAHSAALLVMFNTDLTTAEHDLTAWTAQALMKGLPISSPLVERFAIADRIGNGVASVALVQVHRS